MRMTCMAGDSVCNVLLGMLNMPCKATLLQALQISRVAARRFLPSFWASFPQAAARSSRVSGSVR